MPRLLRLSTLFRHRSARVRRALAERFDPVASRSVLAERPAAPRLPAPFRAPRL